MSSTRNTPPRRPLLGWGDLSVCNDPIVREVGVARARRTVPRQTVCLCVCVF